MPVPAHAFFDHSTWASERLIEVCQELSDEQLDANGDGAFGSIRETLVHTFATEQLYLRRLGRPPTADLVAEGEFPGWDALERAVRGNGIALARAAAELTEHTTLAGDPADAFIEASATVLLVQTLSHSAEHRTQVLTTLTILGAGPAGLDELIDGWSWGVANETLVPVPS